MKRLCGVVLAVAGVLGAPPAGAWGGYVAGSTDDRVDLLVRDGYDHPVTALARLAALRDDTGEQVAPELLFVQAQALIEAQAGHASAAGALAERLLSLSREQNDPLAAAASNLVRAVVAETAGQLDVAAALAQAAASAYQAGCGLTAGTATSAPASAATSAARGQGARANAAATMTATAAAGGTGGTSAGVNTSASSDNPGANPGATAGLPTAPSESCDYRSLSRALQVLERRANSMGQTGLAQEHAQAAFELADAAGDLYRKSITLSALAYFQARNQQGDQATRSMAQAKRMAASLSDPIAMARVRLNEARLADARADAEGGLRATQEGYALAQRANATRLSAVLMGNLSDFFMKQHRPADALRAAEAALPVARQFSDLRAEHALIHNAGVAKIGLHRIDEGKHDLARVLELCRSSGLIGDEALALKAFGEALAAAGDQRGALELYHRERALSAEVMQRNRKVVLQETQARYDTQAKQHSIDLMRSDNAVKTAALANRDLTQRIWLLAAAVMALTMALAALLYRRVRETNRQLAASHAKLRVASERDPLTQLANRRHFHAEMKRLQDTDGPGFTGALLLVDIDHFKHINDGHGHAVGDVVLVEVARRLNDAVRGADLVVRWGGEEFLITSAGVGAAQADQLALRLLEGVGGTPVLVDNKAIWVTASIGYACFPLPPHAVPVPWEQAVNLADMALYTAKSQGRNRAVGVASASAADAASLRAIEGDFERAWHEGRVELRQTPGPGA